MTYAIRPTCSARGFRSAMRVAFQEILEGVEANSEDDAEL